MIDESVHAGPNAVLAFKREGYRRTDINCADLFEILVFSGFWKLARKYYRDGMTNARLLREQTGIREESSATCP